MLFDFALAFSVCMLIAYCYKNAVKHYKTKQACMKHFFALFGDAQEFVTSIYQKIYLFAENDVFDYLSIIINLKKLYDPFSYLFADKETIVITGKLKKRMNAFMHKKSTTMQHYGIKYATKHKEKGKYKVYGNKHFADFVQKYDINKFYVSYMPKKLVKDSIYKCIMYLEMDLCKLDDKDTTFYSDFYKALQDMPDCTDKTFEENKQRCEKEVGTEMMKLNIKQREAEIIAKRQKEGDEAVKTKKNKQNVKYSTKKK